MSLKMSNDLEIVSQLCHLTLTASFMVMFSLDCSWNGQYRLYGQVIVFPTASFLDQTIKNIV